MVSRWKTPRPPIRIEPRARMVVGRRPQVSESRPPRKNPTPPKVPPIRVRATAKPESKPISLTSRSLRKERPSDEKAAGSREAPAARAKTLLRRKSGRTRRLVRVSAGAEDVTRRAKTGKRSSPAPVRK